MQVQRNNIRQFLVFIVVFIPVFVNLDFSNNLRFDVGALNWIGVPSVPLSIIVLVVLCLAYLKQIFRKKHLIILCLMMSIYLCMNFLVDLGTRPVIVFVGMFIPILSYEVFVQFLRNKPYSYEALYWAMLCVFIVKVVADITIFGELVTHNFMGENIWIYNYYDYFPFFYLMLIVLSMYNISIERLKGISTIVIILTLVILTFTHSRLYQYGIVAIPLLWYMHKLTTLKLTLWFNFLFFLVVFTTLILALSDINFEEGSLSARIALWRGYFEHFTIWNFLFPFYNEFRTGGGRDVSFHNELLEQFSFFGFVVFYYYLFFIKNIFVNVSSLFKPYSFLVMFTLVVGLLIQSNFSNPYVGIIFGAVFAIFRKDDKKCLENFNNE